eukprot:15066724-Ditylum_brightwellii.AAC.1
MASILGAFRRHFIPFLVIVEAIIPVMTILITVDAALRIGNSLITLILGPALFASGSYFLKGGVDILLNSCLKTCCAQVRFTLSFLGWNIRCPHARTKHLFTLMKGVIQKLGVSHNGGFINLIFMEVGGGVMIC